MGRSGSPSPSTLPCISTATGAAGTIRTPAAAWFSDWGRGCGFKEGAQDRLRRGLRGRQERRWATVGATRFQSDSCLLGSARLRNGSKRNHLPKTQLDTGYAQHQLRIGLIVAHRRALVAHIVYAKDRVTWQSPSLSRN